MKLLRSYRLLLVALLVVLIPALRAQTPAITSPGNATAQIAVPFAYTINATGNPTSYSIVSTAPSSLIQGVYRGAFGSQTTASGKIWMAGSGQEFPNGPAFAAITSNGSAVAWGNPDAGGNATAVSSSLSSNITAIYSNSQAFAALKSNGSVVTWGDDFYGGSTSGVLGGNLTSGVVSISSTSSAFAALKSNGSVVTWGDPERGGNSTSRVGGNLTSGVTAIFSNANAFAALKSNGSVVTWGDPTSGGNATIYEFGADGSVDVEFSVASRLTSNVVSIAASRTAFAACTTSGSVVTWGDSEWGGNSTSLASSLSSNVTAVFSNNYAFAALRSDGSVVTWGYDMQGGDSSYVSANLTSGVTAIFSNAGAFAALKSNGSVVTWGDFTSGGDSPSPTGGTLASEVKSIASTRSAFAALKNDGSVVTWGLADLGGDSTIFTPVANFENPPIVASVADLLTSNVTAIYATEFAFAALKNNGSVVTWGYADLGGDSSSVSASLSSNVTAIAANSGAFAALKRDGSIVTWGFSAPGDIPAPANIGAPAADITSLTGLSFNSANGSLTGSPTKSGNFSLRIGATNSTGTGTAPFSLLILGAPGMSLSGDLTFGPVFVGQNATRNFSIANPASGPLTVSSIASSNSSFTLTGSTNFTVSPGFSQNVTVRFQPAAPGNFTASITIASNAGNNSLTATGSGFPAASPITITGNLSFGNVTVNQTANSTLSIKNNASNIVTMSVAVPSWLTANATGNFTLAGNATRNVTVTFRPTSEGNFTGNITAISSVGNAIISASGAGVHTRIIGLSGNLSFGNLGVNATATRNLTITNTGTGNLTITGISSSNASFVLTGNTTNLVVGPAGNRTIGVVFQPNSAGNLTGSITVNSTATSGNSSIATSGTGVFVPVITSNLSASGVVGGNFSYQITASNNPISFGNAPALPTGLSLNATTGLISGKPTAPFTGNITLRATNAGGNGTANLTVAILPSRIIGLSGNLSFGNATVNSTFTRNLTITNTGTGNLTIIGISYPQGFSGNWNGTITPNSTRNVIVSFRPPNEGPFNGTITVNSTATSGNSTISSSGTGVHTRIIALSGDLAFGSALANRPLEKNPTRTLAISNSGTGNLTVTRIERPAGFRVFASLPDPSLGGNYTTVNFTYSGSSVSLAELTGNFTLPIAAGTSKSLIVAFSPTAAVAYSGNITVASTASNAAGNSTRAASGTGVTSPLSITGNLSFGNVTVNQQAQRTLSITNLDTESQVLSFAISTGFSVAFSPFPYDVMGNPVTLQAGATVNATVTFSPSSVQAHSGNLSIASASAGNRTIPATGTATHSRIVGLTGNLSLGSVWVNQTANSTFSIRNTGTGPLNVTGISYPAGFSGNWSAGTIAANATQNVTVSFRPTSESPVTGNITVTSNATSGNPTIAASGTGVHSRIISLSGNLSFGSVGVNATANRTLSIRNTGTGPLNVTGITYPAGFSGNFSGTINPNATQNVTVSFRPTTAGNFTGNITLNSTATSGNATIAVSGTAIAAPVITTTNLHGTKGLSFSQRILATTNATTFGNTTALPFGLTLNRTTGLVSGTMPTGPLISFSVNITATSAFGTTTAPVTFWFWDDLLSVAGGSLESVLDYSNTLVPSVRIGKFEVTWFEWKAVREWAVANGYTDLANVGEGSGDLHPVRNVNWYDVLKWCNAKSERDGLTPVYQVGGAVYRTGQSVPIVNIAAKGYRLPTEAEWEWAARGGVNSAYVFSGSSDLNSVGWYVSNSNGGTKDVGQKAANGLGIYDMSGNVREWCWDAVSSDRMTRGGSWSEQGFYCAVAGFAEYSPDSRNSGIGFRLARGSGEPTPAGNVGLSVNYPITGPNTPTSFGSVAGLPTGLSFNATTGLISGTPMASGNFTLNLTATNPGGTGTTNVTISIRPDLITIQGGTLPRSSGLWGTTVSTYRIGTFEVTRSLWQIVRTWGAANGYTDLPSIDPGSNGNCPVQQVSWYEALKWCNARSAMEKLTPVYKVGNAVYKSGQSNPSMDASANGYRLPTEAEWEWAARGGVSTKGYTYSGGNNLMDVGWYFENSGGAPLPIKFGGGLWRVGGLAANEIGLYDMSGNVKEWCWDVWNDDGKISRRQRGGGWSSAASQCALTDRGGSPYPEDRYDDIGFRLARKSGN